MPFDEMHWHELPPHAAGAAMSIGYNAYNWEHGDPPAVEDFGWWELQEHERQALMVLGYDEAAWEDDSDCEDDYHVPGYH